MCEETMQGMQSCRYTLELDWEVRGTRQKIIQHLQTANNLVRLACKFERYYSPDSNETLVNSLNPKYLSSWL